MANDAPRRPPNYSVLDAGVFSPNFNERFSTTESDGEVNPISGFVAFRYGIAISNKSLFLEPAIGVAVPWRSSQDGAAKTFTLELDLAMAVPLFRSVTFRVGPGIYSMLVMGSGGDVVLNNGVGVSTFYGGSGPRVSSNFTVHLGLEIGIWGRVHLMPTVYVVDFLSSMRRSFNASLTLGVRFGK